MSITASFAFALLLSCQSRDPGSPDPSSHDTLSIPRAQMQQALDDCIAGGYRPGLLFGVDIGGIDRWVGAAGTADEATGEPMTPEHQTRGASTTKSYIGALAAYLHCTGRLDLDSAVKPFLNGADAYVINANTATWRQCLDMRAGCYDFLGDAAYLLDVLTYRTAERTDRSVLAYAHHQDPAQADLLHWQGYERYASFAPDSGWRYSNTNYCLVGTALLNKLTTEGLIDSHYCELVRSLFLNPLGMSQTYMERREPAPTGSVGILHGYADLSAVGQSAWQDMWGINAGYGLAAGGFVWTVNDQLTWYREIAPDSAGRVLTGAMKAEIHRFIYAEKEKSWYGLGLMEDRQQGGIYQSAYGRTRGHSGGLPGYTSLCCYWPDYDVTMVMVAPASSATMGAKADTLWRNMQDLMFSAVR